MKNKAQIILALDVGDIKKAEQIVDKLYPAINLFKVGIHLFTAYGPKIVELIRNKGADVFLDLKFFDIPNTVAGAVRSAVKMEAKMLTLHILGDEEMIKAAVKAAKDEAGALKVKPPLLIGVTVLTSKDTPAGDVLTLARIGVEAGLDGVVCSAREAVLLRKEIKKDFVIVTPGIRPQGVSADDQKRTATVEEAIESGSNFLVIGRPILEAKDPLKAAEELIAKLS